jgi:competence protein ComEA
MARRLALAALYLLLLVAGLERASAPGPAASQAPCIPAGRGAPPRHWMGCDGDPGPRRELSGLERLAGGAPIPLNEATPEDLAGVPGLSPRLAIEIVRERARRGPFGSVDDLIRVRGIGPARLGRARQFLAIGR